MADNYIQFSEIMTIASPEERAWIDCQLNVQPALNEALTQRINATEENDDAAWAALRTVLGYEWAVPPECLQEGSLGFQAEWQGDDLWIYAEESGDTDQVAAFVQAWLARWHPDDCFTLTWAGTCSKLRVGEFGGGAILVTRDEIRGMDTWSWAAERQLEFEKGKADARSSLS